MSHELSSAPATMAPAPARRPGRRVAGAASLATVLSLLAILTGCGASSGAQQEDPAQGPGGGKLTVFAAASLTDAFTELARRFEQRTGRAVRTSFAGSSTVATQILQGAPADVFASADRAQMKRVQRDGRLASQPATFVKNRLVVLTPTDNPAGVESMRELAQPGLRLVLATDEVPVTEYAKQLLRDANSRYGKGFRADVIDNVVSQEADVRAAVNRVVTGDADATFAYSSDVTPGIRKQVDIIEIPRELNVTATYPMGVLKRAENKEIAREWMKFVQSDAGQRVLEKWGFRPVQPPSDG